MNKFRINIAGRANQALKSLGIGNAGIVCQLIRTPLENSQAKIEIVDDKNNPNPLRRDLFKYWPNVIATEFAHNPEHNTTYELMSKKKPTRNN